MARLPVGITRGMIHRVTGIPHGGTLVPKTLNSNDWIQFLTGGTSTKNSKGLLINRVIELKEKWTCIIVSLCFTVAGQASDVKLTMLEPISQILQSGAKFDWVDHLAATIKSNCIGSAKKMGELLNFHIF
jgi:hypothetical protein